MAGYIGSRASVTVTSPETDSRYVNVTGDTMSGNLLLPNLGVDTDDDTKVLRLSANATQATSGVAIQLWGKDMGTWGGGIHHIADTRGVDGSHRFWTWDGSAFVNRAVIDEAGRLTLPYQPAFQAGSTAGFVTYSGGSTIPFAFASLNRGNHYNTSTSTFTAPVSGAYYFELVLYSGVNRLAANIALNGSVISGGGDLVGYAFQAGGESDKSISTSLLLVLSANDTVKIIARPGYDAYLYGGHSSFMGYLIG